MQHSRSRNTLPKKLQSNAKAKEQEKARKQQAEVAAQKQLLKLSQLLSQHRLLNQLQLRKHKIHVVKRHVQMPNRDSRRESEDGPINKK